MLSPLVEQRRRRRMQDFPATLQHWKKRVRKTFVAFFTRYHYFRHHCGIFITLCCTTSFVMVPPLLFIFFLTIVVIARMWNDFSAADLEGCKSVADYI